MSICDRYLGDQARDLSSRLLIQGWQYPKAMVVSTQKPMSNVFDFRKKTHRTKVQYGWQLSEVSIESKRIRFLFGKDASFQLSCCTLKVFHWEKIHPWCHGSEERVLLDIWYRHTSETSLMMVQFNNEDCYQHPILRGTKSQSTWGTLWIGVIPQEREGFRSSWPQKNPGSDFSPCGMSKKGHGGHGFQF